MVAVVASRTDALPENHVYRDAGCEYSPSCLSCPFAKCRYDQPIVDQFRDQRDQLIVELRTKGRTIQAIAKKAHCGRRTVFRVLAEAREGGQ